VPTILPEIGGRYDTLYAVECAAHAGTPSASSCSSCQKGFCDACLSWEVDGKPACAGCGAREEDRSRSIGATMLALVGVGYLATLAIGYLLFKSRPYVGGIAAVVAILLGRLLQMYLRVPVVTRREPHAG
jgi:hypothetical protein